MGPPHAGSIGWPIAPWANDLTTELHLAPMWFYGVWYMVKNHSINERGNPPLLPLHCLFPITCKVSSICPNQQIRKYIPGPCCFSCGTLTEVPKWVTGARCSYVVRVFAHGAMGRRIVPSWGWTHWDISHSSQYSMTGLTKAVVCAILSLGWCI